MGKKRVVLCGFGRVGRAFVQLLDERETEIRRRYGIHFELVSVVDIGGAALAETGSLPAQRLISHVAEGSAVESFGPYGRPGVSGQDIIGQAEADLLVETTPTNLFDGEPARTFITAALEKGMDVASANKGPLVLYYKELHELARNNGCSIYISAATAAALPTLDVGTVCLAGTRVLSAEGILNGTTNYILSRMYAEACPYDLALKEAQDKGIAETNPSLDVDGLDTANKMVLISNRIFETEFGPGDVKVKGITEVTLDEVEAVKKAGKVIKLIGKAERIDGEVRLTVAPRALDASHPLAMVNGTEKALSYVTDTMDRVTVTGGKSSPMGAGAALLKDCINAFA